MGSNSGQSMLNMCSTTEPQSQPDLSILGSLLLPGGGCLYKPRSGFWVCSCFSVLLADELGSVWCVNTSSGVGLEAYPGAPHPSNNAGFLNSYLFAHSHDTQKAGLRWESHAWPELTVYLYSCCLWPEVSVSSFWAQKALGSAPASPCSVTHSFRIQSGSFV